MSKLNEKTKIVILKDWHRFRKGDICSLYANYNEHGDNSKMCIFYGDNETHLIMEWDLYADFEKGKFWCNEIDEAKNVYWEFINEQ